MLDRLHTQTSRRFAGRRPSAPFLLHMPDESLPGSNDRDPLSRQAFRKVEIRAAVAIERYRCQNSIAIPVRANPASVDGTAGFG